MRSTLVSVSLVTLLGIPGLAAAPRTDGASPARHMPVPQYISPQARKALQARMGKHATAMQDLVRAGVLLDRTTIKVLAERIESEQTFAFSASLPSGIPASLFSDGKEFVAAAHELAFVAAATRTNDQVLADRFAELTRTCVKCHGNYLRDQRPRNPIGIEPADPQDLLREDGVLYNDRRAR